MGLTKFNLVIRSCYHILLFLGILAFIWIAVTLSIDGYLADPQMTKILLYGLAAFSIPITILAIVSVYIGLLKPLRILEPRLKILKGTALGISQLSDADNTNSNQTFARLQSSHDRLSTLNSVLETRISQLEAEAKEFSGKYRKTRSCALEFTTLCQSHLHSFRGFFNLLTAELSGRQAFNEDKAIQHFGDRVYDAATHLDFLLQDLLGQLGRPAVNTEKHTINLRQLIDEVIACVTSDTSAAIDILPMTATECPAVVSTCRKQMKSLIFHYLSHCLANTSLERLILTVCYHPNELSLQFRCAEFPLCESTPRLRLEQLCESGIASLTASHLNISITEPGWDPTRCESLHVLVVDEDELWRDSICLRLASLGSKTRPLNRLNDIEPQTLKLFDVMIVRKADSHLLNPSLPIILVGTANTRTNVHQVHLPITQRRLQQKLDIILNAKETMPKMVNAGALPFDAGRSLSISNNDRGIATDMLDMLIDTLPGDIKRINDAFSIKDKAALKKEIHRLAGAISFCCVPALQQAFENLNTAVRSNQQHHLETLIENLNHQATQLYSWYASTVDPFQDIY